MATDDSQRAAAELMLDNKPALTEAYVKARERRLGDFVLLLLDLRDSDARTMAETFAEVLHPEANLEKYIADSKRDGRPPVCCIASKRNEIQRWFKSSFPGLSSALGSAPPVEMVHVLIVAFDSVVLSGISRGELKPPRENAGDRKHGETTRHALGGCKPIVVLVVGLLFYAGWIYGACSGQFGPKVEYRTLPFVVECLPALAVFLAACVLRMPLILAGLLAVAGPVILGLVCFVA